MSDEEKKQALARLEDSLRSDAITASDLRSAAAELGLPPDKIRGWRPFYVDLRDWEGLIDSFDKFVWAVREVACLEYLLSLVRPSPLEETEYYAARQIGGMSVTPIFTTMDQIARTNPTVRLRDWVDPAIVEMLEDRVEEKWNWQSSNGDCGWQERKYGAAPPSIKKVVEEY